MIIYEIFLNFKGVKNHDYFDDPKRSKRFYGPHGLYMCFNTNLGFISSKMFVS